MDWTTKFANASSRTKGRIAAVLAAALVASACAPGTFTPAGDFTTSFPEPRASDKFPIQVKSRLEMLVVPVAAAETYLPPAERGRIAHFAKAYRVRGHGPLTVGGPNAAPDMRAVYDAIARITSILSEHGIDPERIAVVETAPTQDGEPAIVLSYNRYVASGPECGYFAHDVGFDPWNWSWANKGCADQHNLAAMVANPADLERHAPVDPPDALRRDVVLEGYRLGESTASERTSQEQGTVSIGQ